MSAPIKTFRKTAAEIRRLYLDYACWLEETEKLTTFQVGISPASADTPLTINVTFADATQKKLICMVGGGKANITYTVRMLVDTDGGQKKSDDIGIMVVP